MARRRPERLRSRRPSPAPKGHASGTAPHETSPEVRRYAAARHDHRQAPVLRSCESEDGSPGRASPAQGFEQSRREFSPADTAAGADHEAVQNQPGRRNGFSQSTARSRTSSMFRTRNPFRLIVAAPCAIEPSRSGVRSRMRAAPPDLTHRKNHLLMQSGYSS